MGGSYINFMMDEGQEPVQATYGGNYQRLTQVKSKYDPDTPGSPRLLRGREEIRGWIEDICGREMTHRVEMQVIGDGGAAFTEACRYPDGTNVLIAGTLAIPHVMWVVYSRSAPALIADDTRAPRA